MMSLVKKSKFYIVYICIDYLYIFCVFLVQMNGFRDKNAINYGNLVLNQLNLT